MNLNLGMTHLRCIVAIADHESFTAAASALGMVQSSLSRSVAEAERRLDVTLFERTTRRVVVTPDGVAVTQYARKMVQDFDEGLAQIGRFVTGDRGTVSVACLPSLAATFLPPYVVQFRRDHPDVLLEIRDGLRQEALTALLTGTVDMALVSAPTTEPGLVHRTLTADSFHCAFAAGHPFDGREHIDWAELAGEPFIAFGSQSSIAGPVARALGDADVRTGPVMHAQNVGAVAGLVAAGLGVTAVPQLVLPMMEFAGLRHAPLSPTVERTISLVRVEGRHETASVKNFVRCLTA
ncbi:MULTISPECIES: LysR family transcriptional regulator [unclassified Rhodococcus (in: high G+C Gram-positive bacteria)]|uniref:LysR family transcriptional regulator n=1 Tax=unclassified Rhodococcus (in: high G+C Gram-positive bacteria) TaxID=192944 RepID=UPI000A830DC9|nr:MULTISPECIES: LysR family transcriptional regulator [unclassified Rhodococcus (in: high G+C Gram-positive bacteria)]MDQ1200438.1 LysR family carnitine catabolism transcriptional activator [Rhodococcus sp. SORGH_AS_0303]